MVTNVSHFLVNNSAFCGHRAKEWPHKLQFMLASVPVMLNFQQKTTTGRAAVFHKPDHQACYITAVTTTDEQKLGGGAHAHAAAHRTAKPSSCATARKQDAHYTLIKPAPADDARLTCTNTSCMHEHTSK
jgi:hypothetical protein